MEKRQDISFQNIASILKRKGIEAEFINIPRCELESIMVQHLSDDAAEAALQPRDFDRKIFGEYEQSAKIH